MGAKYFLKTYSEKIGNEAKQYADIDGVEGVSKTEFRLTVADIIAEDNLDYVNEHDTPANPRISFYTKYGKRILDFVLSGVAMIVISPVILILAVCTFFDVGRPLIFKQSRTGKDEIPFTIVKFRNMTNDTDEKGELLPASMRVTRFGRFVRKTSLDELLNFWSILKGDMSVIGPRPLPEGYLSRFSERHRARHAARPGLECPVMNSEILRPSWGEQFDNDIFYVENMSLKLDVGMCIALVRMVFDKKSRQKRGDSNRGTFLGYTKDGRSINTHKVPIEYIMKAEERLGIERKDHSD